MAAERIKCGMVNCWLICGADGGVLVDAAVPRYKEQIYNRVKNRGVRLILLTHGHPDHVGGAAYLAERLGVPVAMHGADMELVENPRARRLHADTALGRFLLGGAERSLYKPHKFELSVAFEGGEKLDEYGVNARVVALPGHTAGSVGVLAGDEMIVGDAMFNVLKPTVARMYEDKDAMMDSVARIRLTGCKGILPGHGGAFGAERFFSDR
jgi:glyoxylase-like metal-dependent hydrolase (beta-lactamase superfamily II)